MFIYLTVLDLYLQRVASSSLISMEPGPPALGVWSLSHWTPREVPRKTFFIYKRRIAKALPKNSYKKVSILIAAHICDFVNLHFAI